jgi:uncharacterized membrane protein YbhN (UPF0104 family)
MRRLETLIIILALAFYGWLLRRVGFAQVLDYVRLVGWGLLGTIALEAVARVANTLGWRATIANYPRSLRLSELFVARIAGEAIDYVTPSAQLGGQFVMALMVRQKLAMASGLATVIVASLAEMVGQVGFISGVMAVALPYEGGLHHLLWPVAGGMTLILTLAGGFLFVQLKQPFSRLWRMAAKFDIPQLANPEVQAAATDADALLKDFYANHRRRLVLSCGCYLLAWSMGPIEILIYLKLLGQPFTWMTPLLVEALGLLIERATFLIPGKLVSQEGGKAVILKTLAYPVGIGFAIGLLRRLKELTWVALGLIGLAAHRIVTERGLRVAPMPSRNSLEMRNAHGGEMS